MKTFKKRQIIFLFLSVLCFVSLIFILNFSNSNINYSTTFSRFENSFNKYSEELDSKIKSISESIRNDQNYTDLYSIYNGQFFSEKGMIFLIYSNDTLQFWSDNSCPVPNFYNQNVFSQSIHHFENGWYYISSLQSNNVHIIGLLLIKNDYPYQNDYLKNDFNPVLNLPVSATFSLNKSDYNVFSTSGNFMFSVSFDDNSSLSLPYNFHVFLYFLSIILFVLFVFHLLKSINYLSNNPTILFLLFSGFLK